MGKSQRKMVAVVEQFWLSDNIDELIASLQELRDRFGRDTEVTAGQESYDVRYYRPETDREYNARVKRQRAAREREKASKQKKRAKLMTEAYKLTPGDVRDDERVLYEHLKKKYGKEK